MSDEQPRGSTIYEIILRELVSGPKGDRELAGACGLRNVSRKIMRLQALGLLHVSKGGWSPYREHADAGWPRGYWRVTIGRTGRAQPDE